MNAIYKKYRREWSALIALFITIILFSVLEHSYLSATNIATIVTQSVTYGLMGIGMTCVIITGGIDLSVGSSLALLACVGAQLAKAGMPIPIWIVVCLALGFLMGVINGVLVGVMKLQPFIATMGTMQIYRGIGYVITGGFPVLNVPRNYRNVFNFKITSVITFSVIVFFLFAIIITFVLKKMKIGTYAYAVGGNEDAARLSGVRVERTKALLYGIGMLGTTLAALIMIGRLGTGDPSTGQGDGCHRSCGYRRHINGRRTRKYLRYCDRCSSVLGPEGRACGYGCGYLLPVHRYRYCNCNCGLYRNCAGQYAL